MKKSPSTLNPQGIKIDRKSIPEHVRLKLWVFSGGRCEFSGCNQPLWRNSLTMSDGNFAEMAHIIGAKPNAARGGRDSKKLQIDFSNLMLMCARCHKEVDDHEDVYGIERLKKMKYDHEERIRLATERSGDDYQTTILICSINIGERFVPIQIDNVRDAILPRYSADDRGIVINDSHFNVDADPIFWKEFAENRIKRQILSNFHLGFNESRIKHLSVFAIGPMPLIMYLGKCIGDTVPAEIYQSYRHESNPWAKLFDEKCDCEFIVKRPSDYSSVSNIIFLKLAISDLLPDSKHEKMSLRPGYIYEITVQEPSPFFARHPVQLQFFSRIYRNLINEIQERHGLNCHIYLLPAVPNSFAIECGRVLLPRKDSPITVCEFDRNKWSYRPVLELL